MKYVTDALFVVLFIIVPLMAYGLSDVATWLTVGESKYALTVCFPLYCVALLAVLNLWVKRHNKKCKDAGSPPNDND